VASHHTAPLTHRTKVQFTARSLSMHAVCFREDTKSIKYNISYSLSERHKFLPFSLIGHRQQNMVKCGHQIFLFVQLLTFFCQLTA